MAATFKQTSDRLRELGFGLEEQAAALGLKHQTVRAMRRDPASPNYRTGPPAGEWAPKLSEMLKERTWRLEAEYERLLKLTRGGQT